MAELDHHEMGRVNGDVKDVADSETHCGEGMQSYRTQQPTYTRILRSGTTLGLVSNNKRMRQTQQQRKQPVKVWKREKSDGGTAVAEESPSSKDAWTLGKKVRCQREQSRYEEVERFLPEDRSLVTVTGYRNELEDRDMGVVDDGVCGQESMGNKTLNTTNRPSFHQQDKKTKPKSKSESSAVSLLDKQVGFGGQKSLSKSKQDFPHVQGIPEEVFIVSLSKDENKELSVLSTSNGTTLHVGSNRIHKKHRTEMTPLGKALTEKAGAGNHDQIVKGPHGRKENPSWKMSISKRTSKAPFSSDVVDVEKLTVSQAKQQNVETELHSSATRNEGKLTVPIAANGSTTTMYGDDRNDRSNPRRDSLPGNDRVSVNYLEDFEPGNAVPPDIVNETFIDSQNLRSKNCSTFDKLEKIAKVRLRPLSQFPLMEEILTTERFPPSQDSDNLFNNNAHTSQTVISCDNEDPEPPDLIKSPMRTSDISLIKDENVCPTRQLVKRSERIRSKTTSLSVDSKTNFSSATILTCQTVAKPVNATENGRAYPSTDSKTAEPLKHRRHKSTSLLSPPPLRTSSCTRRSDYDAPSKPAASSRASQERLPCISKKKKKRQLEARSKVEKRGKDFSKGKASMSQEVMDAIVKSIEETVSRVRRENEEEERKTLSNDSDRLAEIHGSDMSGQSDVTNANPSNVGGSGEHVKGTNEVTHFNFKATKSTKKFSANSLAKSIVKYHAKTAKTESRGSSEGGFTISANGPGANGEACDKAKRGKRFRKKTRKAEEALGDQDIFWDDDFPVKKVKARKRPTATATGLHETKDASGQSGHSKGSGQSGHRRSKRAQDKEEQMSDPVLEEHAFILWASEHRSEIEQKLPNVTVTEMDSLLSARWCDVTPNVKARFFARARDAFSDDDRQMIKARQLGFAGLDPKLLCGFILDRDPNFHDFVLLPINRQRELLRKWLKFFQKMLPKREYIDFIITFKRACGREDTATFLGKNKRMRMRCLDPVHYKTLFDLIRLSRARVLEAYRERVGKEKKMVSNTYSHMLKNLVNGETWPHMIRGCRSKLLTELLTDLRHLHEGDNKDCDYQLSRPPHLSSFHSNGKFGEKTLLATNGISFADSDSIDVGDFEVTISLTEQDYSVLNTDFAVGLMTDLNKIDELPVLGQDLLDDLLQPSAQAVSTALPVMQVQGHETSCLYNNANPAVGDVRYGMEASSSLFATPSVVVNASNCSLSSYAGGSSCPPNLSESLGYPKINIHYRSAQTSASRLLHCHYPASYSTAAASYRMCQNDNSGGFINSGFNAGKIRSCGFQGNHGNSSFSGASNDPHTYDDIRENMLHTHGDSVTGRCIKVRPRHSQSQVRMSVGPYQVPISSLGPQSKHHPKSLPLPFGSQQMLASDLGGRQGMVVMDSSSISKFDAAHAYHNPVGCRINSPGPLITSLSPFRAIKSSAQRPKVQGQHCQIVPQKSKIHYAGSCYHSDNQGFWKTATAHAIPISTTLRTCGSAVPSRPQSNLGQIKVCLPTQALKIPIAKLRGARKTAFVKGRMKSIHLSSATMGHRSDSSLACQSQYGLASRQNGQSVLAKVLSFQSGADNDVIKSGIPCSSTNTPPALRSSLCTPLVTASKRTSALQICSSNKDRPDSQVHLVSVMNKYSNTTASSLPKMPVSSQTAVIINPLHLQRRPLLPGLGFNSAIVKTSIDKGTSGHRILSEISENPLRPTKEIRLVNSHEPCSVSTCDNTYAEKIARFESLKNGDEIGNEEEETDTVLNKHFERDICNSAALRIKTDNFIEESRSPSEAQASAGNNVVARKPSDVSGFLASTDVIENRSDVLLSSLLEKNNPLATAVTIAGCGDISEGNIPLEQSPDHPLAQINRGSENKEHRFHSYASQCQLEGSVVRNAKEPNFFRIFRQVNNDLDETNGAICHRDAQCKDKPTPYGALTDTTTKAVDRPEVTKHSVDSHSRVDGFGVDSHGVQTKHTLNNIEQNSSVLDPNALCDIGENASNSKGIPTLRTCMNDLQTKTTATSLFSSTLEANLKTMRSTGNEITTPALTRTSSREDKPSALPEHSTLEGQTDTRFSYANFKATDSERTGLKTGQQVGEPIDDDANAAVLAHQSPVKRSGSVVRQSPVFSQVTKSSTPVTASSSCRISPGIFCLERTHTHTIESPRSLPRSSLVGLPSELIVNGEKGQVTDNECLINGGSALTDGMTWRKSSTLIATPTVEKIADVSQAATTCNYSLSHSSVPLSSVSLSTLPHSSVPLSSVPLSSLPHSSVPLSSLPLSTLPHSSLPPSRLPHSSLPHSSLPHSSVVTCGNSGKALPESSLAPCAASPMDSCLPEQLGKSPISPQKSDADGHAHSTVVMVMKRANPSTKSVVVTVTPGHLTGSESARSRSPSPRRKKAHYIHEYLPT